MDLAERIKAYESEETRRVIPSGNPIIIRVDGHGFSKFTKKLNKPFDKNFLYAMEEMTKEIVGNTTACIGYTQSDEATFILRNDNNLNTFFGARVMKLTGIFAGLATGAFYKHAIKFWPELCEKQTPTFDAKVFGVPSLIEAYNSVLSRELDATKNAISMLASHYFSHKSLLKKNGEEKIQRLIDEVGIDFNQLPDRIKRGVFVRNMPKEVYLTKEQLQKIPEKNRPVGSVMRHEVVLLQTPPLLNIENKEGFIFNGESPVINKVNSRSTKKNSRLKIS
jgi:tRNA(His) guanylyltransferase